MSYGNLNVGRSSKPISILKIKVLELESDIKIVKNTNSIGDFMSNKHQ